MKTRETELRAEVDRWLEAAEAADAQEHKLHGASRRGDERPSPGLLTIQKRLAKSSPDASQALEAEAAAAAKGRTRSGGETQGREPQALGAGRPSPRPQKSPIPRRSATLPIPTAACF